MLHCPCTRARALSASDIVRSGTPKRRPFDSSQPHQDLFSPLSTAEAMSPTSPMDRYDPGSRRKSLHYSQRMDESLVSEGEATRQDRAMDHWHLGHGLSIMHIIQPKNFRPMSMYGDAFRGVWTQDWKDINHISSLRSRYVKEAACFQQSSIGPFPQGFTAKDVGRNRAFGTTHGSQRSPAGVVKCGSLCMFA